jgi:4-hydroxy-tetrahydrodipicolinate synthase
MKLIMKLSGTITAMITPFRNQQLDDEGWAHNIRYQIAQGVNGILLFGSTGESPTLAPAEQRRMLSIAAGEAKGKVQIWAGTGTYCTRQTIENTKQAHDLGADVALIVVPYYNKPTQEGIFRHFEVIAQKAELPIVIYNNPGRCGTNIEPATLMRLAELPNIAGIKESTGNINQTGDYLHAVLKKHPKFVLLSGDDIMTLPMIVLGASGVVSVASNLIPAQVVAFVKAALERRFEHAKELHYQLLPLFKSIFMESNPIPIKTAMQLCGMPAGECRLPLCQMAPENINILRQLLMRMQLLALEEALK